MEFGTYLLFHTTPMKVERTVVNGLNKSVIVDGPQQSQTISNRIPGFIYKDTQPEPKQVNQRRSNFGTSSHLQLSSGTGQAHEHMYKSKLGSFTPGLDSSDISGHQFKARETDIYNGVDYREPDRPIQKPFQSQIQFNIEPDVPTYNPNRHIPQSNRSTVYKIMTGQIRVDPEPKPRRLLRKDTWPFEW